MTPWPKEVESTAITNEDSSNPLEVSVVPTYIPWVNGIILLNPDWTLLWS